MRHREETTLRALGAVIGSQVRFVEDLPGTWRVVESDAQLDYPHMLPWTMKESVKAPDPKVAALVDAGNIMAADASRLHSALWSDALAALKGGGA